MLEGHGDILICRPPLKSALDGPNPSLLPVKFPFLADELRQMHVEAITIRKIFCVYFKCMLFVKMQ